MKMINSLMLSIALLSGCQTCAEKSSLVAVVYEQFRAFEAEDLSTVAATLHPDGPQHGATMDAAELIFEATDDLKYKLVACKQTAEGVLRIRQLTTGPSPFRPNIVEADWAFRQDGNQWKLYSTRVLSIEYID